MLAFFLSSEFIGAIEGFLLVARVCACVADDTVGGGEAGGGGNDSEVAWPVF